MILQSCCTATIAGCVGKCCCHSDRRGTKYSCTRPGFLRSLVLVPSAGLSASHLVDSYIFYQKEKQNRLKKKTVSIHFEEPSGVRIPRYEIDPSVKCGVHLRKKHQAQKQYCRLISNVRFFIISSFMWVPLCFNHDASQITSQYSYRKVKCS